MALTEEEVADKIEVVTTQGEDVDGNPIDVTFVQVRMATRY